MHFTNTTRRKETHIYIYDIVKQCLYENSFYDYLRTALQRLFDDSCFEGAVSTAVQNTHNYIIITDTATVIHPIPAHNCLFIIIFYRVYMFVCRCVTKII